MDDLEYHFPKESTSDSYVLRLVAVPQEARLIRETIKARRHEYESCGGERVSGNAMEREA